MPLLEVNQIRHICPSVRVEEATAAQVDQYAAFIRTSADDIGDSETVTSGASEQPGKKVMAGVESTPPLRTVKAWSCGQFRDRARTVLRTGRIFDTPSLEGLRLEPRRFHLETDRKIET